MNEYADEKEYRSTNNYEVIKLAAFRPNERKGTYFKRPRPSLRYHFWLPPSSLLMFLMIVTSGKADKLCCCDMAVSSDVVSAT